MLKNVSLLGVAILATLAACTKVPDDHPMIDTDPDFYPVILTKDGLTSIDGEPLGTLSVCEARTCVVGLHGFLYDPADEGYYSPFFTIYAQFGDVVARRRERLVGVGWSSVTFTAGNMIKALLAGNATPFGLARERAVQRVPAFAAALAAADKPLTILCHSLGCLIAVEALARAPRAPVERVVMLNAAIEEPRLAELAERGLPPLVNVFTPTDSVLKAASLLRTGRRDQMIGTGPVELANHRVVNVEVTPEAVGSRFGSDLSNPNRFFDHLYAFEAPQEKERLARLLTAPFPSLEARERAD
jgi:pimeloyl-ACP methyl ester carboxylesterase